MATPRGAESVPGMGALTPGGGRMVPNTKVLTECVKPLSRQTVKVLLQLEPAATATGFIVTRRKCEAPVKFRFVV